MSNLYAYLGLAWRDTRHCEGLLVGRATAEFRKEEGPCCMRAGVFGGGAEVYVRVYARTGAVLPYAGLSVRCMQYPYESAWYGAESVAE